MSDRMTPERWRQVTGIFHAALARDARDRAAYLDDVCASDRALREEVDAMLAAHHDPRVFADRPVTGFRVGNPTRLFDRPYLISREGRTYDVSPDGQRFLMTKPVGNPDQTVAPTSLIVVQNWHEELKRLVPLGKR